MENQQAKSKSLREKCVSVIFNPVSGKGDPEERKKLISEALAKHDYTCQFIATSKESGAKELAEKAVRDGVDLLVISGGDGTIMEAIAGLVGTAIPIAVIPAGTGNLLSVNLGIPGTVPEAVEIALAGEPYQLDLGRTGGGDYFAIMGGLGIDAQMIADAGREAKNKFGVLAYFWAALKNLRRRRAHILVHLDDRAPIRRRVKTALIANMGKVTGGILAMPTASPNDGLLDVGLLKSETLAQWLRLVGYALLGRTQDSPDFEVYQARKIRIETRTEQPVEFDGESVGEVRSLHVEVVPKAVTILLPTGSAAARAAVASPAQEAQAAAKRTLLLPAGILVLTGILLAVWRRKR